MINRIRIENFRSIEKAEVDLAPLTILYGPTSGGKSSLLYSLLVLRNFVLNPNQPSDGFFNIGFMNLSGYDNCVFNQEERAISIFFSIDRGEYGISLEKNAVDIFLNSNFLEMKAKVSIPYGLYQNFQFEIQEEEQNYIINWNGISVSVSPELPTTETQSKAMEIARHLNQISEYLKKVDIAPHKRGFFKPSYSPVPVTLTPTSDDEVATIIINDPYLAPKISVDLEKILNRDFRIYTPPGTATAFFLSTHKSSRTSTYLVNEGFGVNQIVYSLAKIHRPEIKTILIEEPEIHLHPSIIRKLVEVLYLIVKEDGKQIILTTHSEVFLSSVLARVRKKDLNPADIKCYLVTRDNKKTKFEEQKVNEKGQIEGGLSSFVEGELEELKFFLEET